MVRQTKKPEEVSATEAARQLGLGLNYLYVLLRTGKLAARRVDGRWLVSVDAVADRLKNREAYNA